MTDITEAANKIQVQETDFNSPVSESLHSRMGGSINFNLGRNARWVSLMGDGFHRISRLNDLQPYHYIPNNTLVSSYFLTNGTNGSSGSIRINAAVENELGVFINNLFSVAPSINSAISTPGNKTSRVVGRKVEEGLDIGLNTNTVIGTLNFTQLDAGWRLRFFAEEVMVDGAAFKFDLRLREID